ERENPREKWTVERLDDLNERVDDGFREMREEFRAVRGEIGALSRTFIQVAVGGFITMAVGFAATIATVLAHG
ncbi:MAG TPA: hypothetical protein VHR18_09780, partial [Solirubrobacterales bacterium]|nr:hypothetical protein [Solirubrobacterales bacterium]